MSAYVPYYTESRAIVIGIDNYELTSPLGHATQDAADVAKALVEFADFEDAGVQVLLDRSAKKQDILDAFYALECSQPNDRVLFFFAGHGHTVKGLRGDVGFLVPQDGDPNSLATLISWDELIRFANLIPAKHMLFVMDACYSGLALQRSVSPGVKRFLSDMLERPSRQVITAGKADEMVADGGGKSGRNSIFTSYLIDGLRDNEAESDSVLTASGLLHFVYQRVGADDRSQQTPSYGHCEGDGDMILRSPSREHFGPTKGEPTAFVLPGPTSSPNTASEPTDASSLFEAEGYSDSRRPNFGRNDWSRRLGELDFTGGHPAAVRRAQSWAAFLLEPSTSAKQVVDLDDLPLPEPGSDAPDGFKVPRTRTTTLDCVVLYDRLTYDATEWGRALRIHESGALEYLDTKRVFFASPEARCFRYVQLVGLLWQFATFGARFLKQCGVAADANLYCNLVGSRGTILCDFADSRNEKGTGWIQPYARDRSGTPLVPTECPTGNISLRKDLNLEALTTDSIESLVRVTAAQLGRAYNHQSAPRCYAPETTDFPWHQFQATEQTTS